MVSLLHAMVFMVFLLVGWVIWNNKPLPLPLPYYHHISVIQLKQKRLRQWPIFSLWTPNNWKLTSWIRWRDTYCSSE